MYLENKSLNLVSLWIEIDVMVQGRSWGDLPGGEKFLSIDDLHLFFYLVMQLDIR